MQKNGDTFKFLYDSAIKMKILFCNEDLLFYFILLNDNHVKNNTSNFYCCNKFVKSFSGY